MFTAETQRTQRKRREALEISKSFSLRFLGVLCVSAVKKAQPLSVQSMLTGVPAYVGSHFDGATGRSAEKECGGQAGEDPVERDCF